MTDVEIRRSTELSLPMRSLEESTRIIQESYQKEGELAQAYLDEVVTSGRELAAVKAHDTYGEGDYINFDEYCKNELPYGSSAARRRILFYEVTKAAREVGAGEPTSLNQMDALVKAVKGGTEDRVAHWLSMAGGDVEVTTKSIQSSVSDPGDEKGEGLSTIQHQAEQDALEKRRQELEAREQTVSKLEAKAEKLERHEMAIKAEREQVDAMAESLKEREELMDLQYAETVAGMMAKYGEEPQPGWIDIPDEAWAEAFAEAKSVRVMNAAKYLHKLMAMPRVLGEYFPSEFGDAILDFDHKDEFIESLHYIIRRLQEIVDYVEDEALEGGDR